MTYQSRAAERWNLEQFDQLAWDQRPGEQPTPPSGQIGIFESSLANLIRPFSKSQRRLADPTSERRRGLQSDVEFSLIVEAFQNPNPLYFKTERKAHLRLANPHHRH